MYETTKDKHDDNKSKYQLPQITVALLMNTFIMLLKDNDEELKQICGDCLAWLALYHSFCRDNHANIRRKQWLLLMFLSLL